MLDGLFKDTTHNSVRWIYRSVKIVWTKKTNWVYSSSPLKRVGTINSWTKICFFSQIFNSSWVEPFQLAKVSDTNIGNPGISPSKLNEAILSILRENDLRYLLIFHKNYTFHNLEFTYESWNFNSARKCFQLFLEFH